MRAQPPLLDDTADQSAPRREHRDPVLDPGLVQLFADDGPVFATHAIAPNQTIALGRGDDCDVPTGDRRTSRRHVEITRGRGRWTVRDLASHNGTFVDGGRIVANEAIEVALAHESVVAIGNSIYLLVPNVSALAGGVATVRDAVIGPRSRTVWDLVGRIAKTADSLHVVGETGSGKELVARHYHARRAPAGPFVAVNCAAVPPLLAERLFFGARRGTFTGADADSDGYLVAAEGGVLFLDEIGELTLDVQAKLLRALESREVLPLGAAKPRTLDLAICSATHVDLRSAVARGAFREDLYFRIAEPAVALPPLRERREEIPWLVAGALAKVAPQLRAHASFVEAALVRPWPGNVRELARAVEAAARALADGETQLKMAHLADQAGRSFVALPVALAAAAATTTAPPPPPGEPLDAERRTILDALRAENGNVTRAASTLGLHRNQLRRWLAKHDIDQRQFKSLLHGASSGAPDDD